MSLAGQITTAGYIHWNDYLTLIEKIQMDRDFLEKQEAEEPDVRKQESIRNRIIHKNRSLLLMVIGVTTALRIGDILELKWNDLIDADGKVVDEIIVSERKTQKKKKRRTITIASKPAEIILDIWNRSNARPTEYIFMREKHQENVPVTTQFINQWLKRILKEYKIKCTGNISSHLFRKTFGRRMLDTSKNKEMGLILLMETFNHTNLEITKRYLGIRQDEIKSVYTNVWE